MSEKPVERQVLPAWLYPAAFWVSLVVLAAGLFSPLALRVGVLVLMASPVLAAIVVVFMHWRQDRRLAAAALYALIGLVAVFLLRGFID